MKARLIVSVGLVLLVAACEEKSSKSTSSTNTTASGTAPLDAPAGYLGAMAKGQQSAIKTVDTASLKQAIQMFNVDQGRNPKDLKELVEKKYMPKLPDAPYGMKIVYDPDTGNVKVQKQ